MKIKNKTMKKILIQLFVILCVAEVSFAQQNKIDSELALLKKVKEDTSKVSHVSSLARALMYSNPDTSIVLAEQALQILSSTSFHREEGAIKSLFAQTYNNHGIYNHIKGDYLKALDYYLKALKIDEELSNKTGIVKELNNIGIVYWNQSDYPKALDYYLKALKIDEELGDENGIASGLGNIGIVYSYQADYPKALDYYLKALQMEEKLGDENKIAIVLGNIGTLYTKTGKFKEANVKLKKAIELDDSIGAKNDLRQLEESLSQLYDTTGRYKLALEHYKKAMVLKDTIFNQEKTEEITRKEMQYHFDKMLDSLKLVQVKKEAAEQEAKRIKEETDRKTYLTIFIGILVTTILVFRYRRRQKKYSFLFFSFTLHQAIKMLGRFALLLLFKLIELVVHKPIGEATHENALFLFIALVFLV